MDKEILVSLDLHGAVAFVGRLWCRTRRGRHSASFEYDAGWLAHPERFALEPALMLAPGPFHTAPGDATEVTVEGIVQVGGTITPGAGRSPDARGA